MKLFNLTLPQLRDIYDTEIMEAFPPAERKPFSAMELLYHRGRYLPYGAVDETGAIVGYALLWSSLPGSYVLLDYLGVTKPRRNGGLGAEILRLLHGEFARWEGILIESEAPDGGEEDAMRHRRLGFYQRAGCVPLPHDAWLFGVHYRSLLLETSGRHNETRALEAHRELYYNYFHEQDIMRFVRVPYDPKTESVPEINWDKPLRTV